MPGRVTYGTAAPSLLDRGFQPLPAIGKAVKLRDWAKVKVDAKFVNDHATRAPKANVGIRTGQGDNAVYGVDVDFYDQEVSKTVRESFEATFGKGLARVGQAPKVLLLYRGAPGRSKITSAPFETIDDSGEVKTHKVEILGQGQQFVGFGVHPDTGRDYSWEGDSPLDTDAADLPVLDLDQVAIWVRDVLPTLVPDSFKTKKAPTSDEMPSDREAALATADDRTMRDITAAMRAFTPADADIYEFWILIGQALKSLEQAGRSEAWHLWHDFSKLSPRYDYAESEEKWASFSPNVITYKSIFFEAKKRDYRLVESDPQVYDVSTPAYTEFTIDGFLSIGVTIVAGAPGVGKTNLLVPLACQAAHLCAEDSQLRPTLRRKVVYVTEDPRQVRNILYALRKHIAPHIPAAEWAKWFVLEQAHRRDPKAMATLIAEWRKRHGYKAGDEFLGYWIEPLVVLDTSNATLELESENDNSEAGRAVAAVKEALGGASLWLVAHVAKMDRKSINNLTARGASAFEGDANGVAYIIHDEKVGDNVRHMILGKRRYQPDHTEIEFSTKVDTEIVETPWGERQTIRFIYGTPTIPVESRAQAKARAEEREQRRKDYDKRQRILDYLERCGDKFPTKTDIRSESGVNANEARAIVEDLIAETQILVVSVPGMRGGRCRLNPDYVAPLSVDSDEEDF